MCHASRMGIDWGDAEVEKLAREIAAATGETETEAVRVALRERHDRLGAKPRKRKRPEMSMHEWLEREIWPHIPPEELGKPPLTKAEVEEILGIGPEGY
jgi:hypothetical protein